MPNQIHPKQGNTFDRRRSSARIAIRCRAESDSDCVEKFAMEHYDLCTLMMYQRIIDHREKHPSALIHQNEEEAETKELRVNVQASSEPVSVLFTNPKDGLGSMKQNSSILPLFEEEYDAAAIFDIDL